MKTPSSWNVCVLLATGIFLLSLASPSGMQAQKSAAGAPLNPQESRGEGLYLQHCALCHSAKVVKPHKSVGPNLSGALTDATPEQEKAIRQFILTGTERMPGFQYGLKPSELDDIIAYLKVL